MRRRDQTHRCKCKVVPDATLEMVTSLSQYTRRLFKYADTCSESSRVGTRIRARVTCLFSSSGANVWTESQLRIKQHVQQNAPTLLALKIFCTTGIQYAAVFPLPVRARARISRLSRASGMALAWTRVGRAKPASASARRIRASRIWEREANVAFLSTR